MQSEIQVNTTNSNNKNHSKAFDPKPKLTLIKHKKIVQTERHQNDYEYND
jgi:hypothetical protein